MLCRFFACLVGLCAAFAVLPAHADFDAAQDAYKRGDYSAAHAELAPLVTRGHPSAEILLGSMYIDGLGVPADPQRGLALYRSAALADEPLGMYLLGRMFLDGTGVEKNPELGLMWLHNAADSDEPRAQALLGRMYWHGQGVAQDRDQGLALLRKAAASDSPLARKMAEETGAIK